MNKIILVPNPKKDQGFSVTKKIVKKLSEFCVTVYLDEIYRHSELCGVVYYKNLPKDAHLIIVVGGDGSVIEASKIAIDLDVPILGFNLGKVGYLVEVEPQNIDILSSVIKGEYIVGERMLLEVKKNSQNGEAVIYDRFAVNDVVISHENYFGISDFKVENEHGDNVQYRADGVIVSTPLGSTAYSLSAGGAIVSHSLNAIMVTPVCPHSFFNRAIVYGDNEKIRVENLGDSLLNISVDGRYFSDLKKNESCVVYKSDKKFKVVTFGNNNVFTTLSKKIKILHDSV